MTPSAARLNAGKVTSIRWYSFIYFACMLVLIPAWLQSGAQAKPDPKAGPLYASIEQLQGSAKWRVFAAVVTHDHERLRALLGGGDSPNYFSARFHLPIAMACQLGDLEAVQILVRGGATVNLFDKQDQNALMAATMNIVDKRPEIMRYLLANGADPNLASPSSGKSAFFAALRIGDPALLSILIEGGADVNLTVAVKLMLANGADINNADAAGNTALMQAIENGHSSTIFALLGAGAEVRTVNRGGVSTLLQAATYHDDPKLVQYLLEHGVPANAGSEINETPLMAAACYGHIETVKLLLKLHVPVNPQSNEGLTALSEAAICGSADAVRLLLDAGADAAIKDGDGKIVADYATKQGRADILTLLKGQIPQTQTPPADPAK